MEFFLNILTVILFTHWFGDFVLQSRWMADNKSKSILALTAHVSVYSLTLFVGLLNPWLSFADQIHGDKLLYFVGANFILHWLTDFITSNLTKYFWNKKDVHSFFVVVGFDQLIHQFCLILTIEAFFCR